MIDMDFSFRGYAGEWRRLHLLYQPLGELQISVTAAAPAHAVAV
jgi:hypothetical protein